MKVLLHICCAPCSIECIASLREEGISPVGFWDNPNIHPFTEHRSRKNALIEYAAQANFPIVQHGAYGLRPFLQETAASITNRCNVCYDMRMQATARYASENGFSHFSTTLFISPYQDHRLLRTAAERAACDAGITLLYRDFRPAFRSGQTKARALGLYMQKYCGCIFSEEERYQKRSPRHQAL